ncbi:MAG: C_GCAxxG_C_C family protein [Anaerolineaceae bacterium]|nr:C_GCAxxG_C_C family protein [Anaerolineaceae bacterium]
MDKSEFDQVAIEAGKLDSQNHHCSESVVIAAGKYLLGEVDPTLRKVSTAFGGGYGDTREEACGALSGGVLLIGALHGRLSNEEDDSACRHLVAAYYERFVQEFGAAKCRKLREKGYGIPEKPCSILISGASKLLLGVLAEYEEKNK